MTNYNITSIKALLFVLFDRTNKIVKVGKIANYPESRKWYLYFETPDKVQHAITSRCTLQEIGRTVETLIAFSTDCDDNNIAAMWEK